MKSMATHVHGNFFKDINANFSGLELRWYSKDELDTVHHRYFTIRTITYSVNGNTFVSKYENSSSIWRRE
jgi:hypothetical protein